MLGEVYLGQGKGCALPLAGRKRGQGVLPLSRALPPCAAEGEQGCGRLGRVLAHFLAMLVAALL